MEKSQERDLVDPIFSPQNFVRTLSYREFVTSFSLALLLLALHQILAYYSSGDWFENSGSLISIILFCVFIPLNHVFYKIEHKRQNNFVGRNLHDYIFLLLSVPLFKLRLFLMGDSLAFQGPDVAVGIFVLLFILIAVILFELVVAMLKRVLRYFRWQIL